MKRLKNIISIFIKVIYFTLLVSLLLTYLSPYANPKKFLVLSFFGLTYPYLLLANLFFLIWWIIRWNKLYWLSLACILLGWVNMKHLFHLGGHAIKGEQGIKIMTYNVRLFDRYNWTNDKDTRSKIFSFLKDESADILCLQEFFHGDSGQFKTRDTLMDITGAKDRHIEYTLSRRKKDHYGIATFSKYPIVNKGKITFKTKSNNICIFSDLKINQDTVRLYNVHFQSIHFGYADYKFIDALKEQNDTLDAEDIEIASKNILRRLKRAFAKRAEQTEKVLEHITTCKYPVIVCGDFNDTPFSYTYRSFSEKLQDAFMESGSGIGSTYLGTFPSYRIDYIFYSDNFTSSGFEVLPEKLSDHYPMRCYIHPRTAD